MKPLTTIFLLALLLVVPLASLVHADDNVIPLEYDYAGDLIPGHKITIRIHALGIAATLGSAFADAGVDIGGWRYGIIGDDGVVPIHVKYFLAGRQLEIDKIWQGQKEYDAYITLYAYCPGEKPSGAPYDLPDETWIWVYVDFNGEQNDWFPVQLTANTAPRIQVFYEKASVPLIGTKQSWAHLEDDTVFKDCNENVIGNPPSEGHDTRLDEPSHHGIDIEKYIVWGFGIIAVLGALALLPNFLRR